MFSDVSHFFSVYWQCCLCIHMWNIAVMSDMHLLGGSCSFRSVQWLESLAFRAYWNVSEMEWGCPVGKQLQSCFLLSVFCVCEKTNNAADKIHIFLPHYSYAESCTTCSLSKCHIHGHFLWLFCSLDFIFAMISLAVDMTDCGLCKCFYLKVIF